MSTAALGLSISRIAPIDGVPAAPLPYFLHRLPERAHGDATDITARIGRITTAGNAADSAADDLDVAADDTAAAAARARLDTARATLCNELTALRETHFWVRRHSILRSFVSVPAEGCGLLNVLTWIYQRDASIYKVVVNLKERLADTRYLPDLMWALEVRCFVYPENGPLDGLLQAMIALGIAWDAAWAAPMIEALRSDDFWIPTGTRSLDKLRAAVIPAAARAGGLTALPEADVRTQLARFGWAWATLRDTLKASPDNLLILQRILLFRWDLTNTLMSQSVAAVAPEEQPRFTPYRRVRFSVPGSTRPTSDIDVNMRGSATERVAIEFNRRFRAWTLTGTTVPAAELESGYVFDVNVYAQDYTRELGLRYMKPNVPEADVWPTAGTPQWTEAEKSQDVYALIKMRRYMPAIAFGLFTMGVRTSLTGSTFVDRVTAAATQGDVLAAAVEAEKRNVLGLLPDMSAFPGNVTIRAQNNLYATQLQVVYTSRGFGAALDDAAKLALIQQLGKAAYLAQEAYGTAGAVRDIVSNLQMGQGLTLTMYEQMHSFNEQVADIFKDAGHFPDGETVPLDFAVEASKYMARMAAAALSVNYNVVTTIFEAQFARLTASSISSSSSAMPALEAYSVGIDIRLNALLDLQATLGLWRDRAIKLMNIKDDPTAYQRDGGAWNDTAAAILAGAPWPAERTGFTDALLTLAVIINIEARSDPTSTMHLGLAGEPVVFQEAREEKVEKP
jgi:hypothetical protein